MIIIDIRELEEHLPEIMRHVKDGQIVRLMEQGAAVATISPVHKAYSQAAAEAFLAKLDRMAEEIGRYLPEQVDAVETVREIRREV